MQMDGLSGKTGWRWIFIMEGIVCILYFHCIFLQSTQFTNAVGDHLRRIIPGLPILGRFPRKSGPVLEIP